MGCVGHFVHTLGLIKYPAEQLKVIYNVLATYKLVQLFIVYSTAVLQQSLHGFVCHFLAAEG